MEHSSKIEEQIEAIKSKMDQIKNPAKTNLKKISEITEQFETATAALLNPIKKLKISYNMRINSFKGKYENVLASIKHKISALEKNKKSKDIKNINSVFIEETAQQNNEITREHGKLMNLLEECLQSICALNRLFDTEEFLRLDELTKCLSPVRKKTKVPMLELNEDNNAEGFWDRDSQEAETGKNGKSLNGKHKEKINGHAKAKNKSNGEEIEVIELDNFSDNENNLTKINASNNQNKKANKHSSALASSASKASKSKSAKKPLRTGSAAVNLNSDSENEVSVAEENEDLKNKAVEDSKTRRLSDEECLERMKERFPEDKGLTKTFITRKLKKRIAIYRKLDFNDEETYKGVENTIPKKSGPNSFLKVTMEVCNRDDYSLSSPLMFFMKDLFNTYFIIFKEKEKKMKIVIAGHITKDIISFLKRISSEEFRNKYSVQTMKIKAYAFYEELVHEFSEKKNIIAKKINDADIKEYVEQFKLLTQMRKAFEEIKQMKVDKD